MRARVQGEPPPVTEPLIVPDLFSSELLSADAVGSVVMLVFGVLTRGLIHPSAE
jgi:hypothetical protein